MRFLFLASIALFLTAHANADTEPNNIWPTALDLPAGKTIAGTQSDDDWFVINATVGNRVLIDLTFTDADGNIDLVLYDDAGNIDPQFPGTPRSISNSDTDHEFIDADISGRGAGTYYIRVSSGTGGDQGNGYTLTWTEMGADDGFEENDDSLSAAAIAESTVAFGSKSDQDWYSIEVAPGGGGKRVLASLRFNIAVDLDLQLRETDGTLLASSGSGVGVNEVIDFEVADFGSYHLALVGSNNNGNGYALTWAAVSPGGGTDFPAPDVNEVPVATANTVSTPENTAYNFTTGDFTFTDTEGDSLVSATVTNLSLGGGALTHSGGTTLSSGDTHTLLSAQLDTLVYTPPANVTGSPLATFDFTVNDIGLGTVASQMDINVTVAATTPPTTTPAPSGGGSSGSMSLVWLLAVMLIGLVARRVPG